MPSEKIKSLQNHLNGRHTVSENHPMAGNNKSAGYANSTNGWAVVSLVFAILGWTFVLFGFGQLIAVVAGHIARRQISRRGQAGDGMAVAGLVLGYILILPVLMFLIVGLVALAVTGSADAINQLRP